jgi:hypothetical protein
MINGGKLQRSVTRIGVAPRGRSYLICAACDCRMKRTGSAALDAKRLDKHFNACAPFQAAGKHASHKLIAKTLELGDA